MCDYCGRPGCSWQAHPEAQADVRAWQREQDAERELHDESGVFDGFAFASDADPGL